MCCFGLCESLKTVVIIVIFSIFPWNPNGGGQMGAKPQMGACPPRPTPWRRPWDSCTSSADCCTTKILMQNTKIMTAYITVYENRQQLCWFGIRKAFNFQVELDSVLQCKHSDRQALHETGHVHGYQCRRHIANWATLKNSKRLKYWHW